MFSPSPLFQPPDWTSSFSKCEWVVAYIVTLWHHWCFPNTTVWHFMSQAFTFIEFWRRKLEYPSISLSSNTCSMAGILPQNQRYCSYPYIKRRKVWSQSWCYEEVAGHFLSSAFDKGRTANITVYLSDVGRRTALITYIIYLLGNRALFFRRCLTGNDRSVITPECVRKCRF